MSGSVDEKLRNCEIELQQIQEWIDKNTLDTNVKYLTSYAVVKASGTTERVLKEMLFDKISCGSSDEAKYYFTKYIIEAPFNPSIDNICKILNKMNDTWKREFKDRVMNTTQKNQLDSLMGFRNSFAHGIDITSSIADIINYFNSAKWILNQLDNVLYQNQTS